MKWFDNWFQKKCRESWENAQKDLENISKESYPVPSVPRGGRLAGHDNTLSAPGINFTMYRANGGFIVEHAEYDSITDRRTVGLHIIPSGKDLGESLGSILTYEMLKK